MVELSFFDRITTMRWAEYSQWVVRTFNEQHQGKIHVTWSATEDETFKPKINVVLRDPHAPDIFFTWEGGWAKYMIDSGYAAPLDEYYEKYGWDKILNPAGSALATLEGRKYFVPTRMAASVVWYRPDIFASSGLPVPQSWPELLAAATKLKARGIAPFILANQKRWPAQFMWTALFVNQHGLDAYNRLLSRKIPWTDERVVGTFKLMKDLSDQGLFEVGANALDVIPAFSLFASGKAAMWYQGSFLLARFTDDSGQPLLPLNFFPFPPIGHEPPTMSVFVEDGLMINSHGAHRDEAAAFLAWAVSRQVQERLVDLGMPYPANVEVGLEKSPPVVRRLGEMIAKHSTATFMHIDHALPPAVANPFLDYLQAVLVGTMPPERAAELTERAAQGADGGS